MNKRSKIFLGIFIVGFGFLIVYLYLSFYLNPFGPCDGSGTPNEYVKYYYEEGNIKKEGSTDKWCKWTGLVKEYYENGQIKSEVEYKGGMTNGTAKYFSTTGKVYKQDSCLTNNILYSKMIDTLNSSVFELSKTGNVIFSKQNHKSLSEIVDKRMVVKETALINEHIYIRTDKSVFIINDSLIPVFSLFDSINKFAPDDFLALEFEEKYVLCGWFPQNQPDSVSCSIWMNEFTDYKGEMKFKIK